MMLMGMSSLAYAQKSWYAGAGIGAQVFCGMNDHQMDFGDRLAPTFDVKLGRWINPWFAIDANLSFAEFKGVYNTPKEDKHFVSDTRFGDEALSFRKQEGWYTNFHVNAKFDLINILSNNVEDNRHHVAPYVGLGFASGLKSADACFAPTLHVGLEYRYQINNSCGVLADFNNYWVSKALENEDCDKHPMHCVSGLKVGFVYSF